MLRFSGFELDPKRAELRGPGGALIRLRPKTFELLRLLGERPREVLAKQELMAAIWPEVHVADDSLFQCIRELRVALGDERRQLIKAISGRGYRLDADVDDSEAAGPPAAIAAAAPPGAPAASRSRGRLLTQLAVALLAVVAAGALLWRADLLAPHTPTVAIMPIASTNDSAAVGLAAAATRELTDGLAKIVNLRVLSGEAAGGQADFVVTGELQQSGAAWTISARMSDVASKQVVWTSSATEDIPGDADLTLQQSRLAASIGYDLALKLNDRLVSRGAGASAAAETGKVLVQQATDYMNQTSPERFHAAQAMLEDGLVHDPHNADIQVALAAVLVRGVQMAWYTPEQSAAAQTRARSMLAQAIKTSPDSVPVQDAWCRLLTSEHQFSQSLVACARALTFEPWDGIALYHLGLTQMQLGRFDDALATFRQADAYDMPAVSRWTWVLGMGWTYTLMGRGEDALPWLDRAIAITPASGRVYFLLAAAYQELGRTADAAAAVAKGLALRPESNAGNIRVPATNTSPLFLAANDKLIVLSVAAGLPKG